MSEPTVTITSKTTSPLRVKAGNVIYSVPSTWTGEWHVVECSECGFVVGQAFKHAADESKRMHLILHKEGLIVKGKK